jgi:hypothetical protein
MSRWLPVAMALGGLVLMEMETGSACAQGVASVRAEISFDSFDNERSTSGSRAPCTSANGLGMSFP